MNEVMIANTDAGRTVQGGVYVNVYSPRYAKQQLKELSPVTLQSTFGDMTKRSAGAMPLRGGATVTFREDAEVMRLHQTGEAKGGKKRQMYPESYEQFPDSVLKIMTESIKKRMQ
jgi:hypothetical protein